MRCVVQRVTRASVRVDGETVGAIALGFMVLVGVERGDTEADAQYCADKVAGLRVFEDAEDKMNLSLGDVGGAVLAVSQFTLCGDTRHGRRPSFIEAERPEAADALYGAFCAQVEAHGLTVARGRFQTHMEVELINDGPVTLMLDSRKRW